MGVTLGPGTGVEQFDSLSTDRLSVFDRTGVAGRLNLSVILVGDRLGLPDPSIMRLMSRTDDGCMDCIRRCVPPLIIDLSGEPSVKRLGREAAKASRARSLSAACADWIALEVPAREVNLGDCGFKGSGGGHRSGSELSHLFEVSRRKKDI